MPTNLPAEQEPGPPAERRRVLVTGASGFLGRAVVRSLAESGYEVRGLVRDPARGEQVRESGGIPVVGDVLQPASLTSAARGCWAAIHLAAHAATEVEERRVRIEGVRSLGRVATAAGIERIVVGSGYWVYRGQPELITESSPVDPRGESEINFDTEAAGFALPAAGGPEVVVVRPGMVYGNGSWFRGLSESVRSGGYSVVGTGSNRWSFVALPDAARAFSVIVRSGVAGEVYNVVDGQPAPLREFVDFVARELGVRPPPSVELGAAEASMGSVVAHHLAADRAVSSQKLTALGWQPRLPTYRDGVPPVLREMFPRGGNARR